MAKKTSFTLRSSVPVERLHQIVISDAFLLSTEEMEEGEQVNIIYSDKQVDEDGTVRCVVIGRPAQPATPGEQPATTGNTSAAHGGKPAATPAPTDMGATEHGSTAPAEIDAEAQGSTPSPTEIDATGHDSTPSSSGVKQTTAISPIAATQSPSFRMSTVMPLPAGLATMFTDMHFLSDQAAGGSIVEVKVRVESSLPIVGGRIAKQLLGNSEATVNKGLRRAERLAQR